MRDGRKGEKKERDKRMLRSKKGELKKKKEETK